jgi:hypothetical protein
MVTLAFLKNPRSSIGLEIRSQSAFTTFRTLLHTANYSILLSDLVGCDNPLHIAMALWHIIFNLKRATQLLFSAVGCHT